MIIASRVVSPRSSGLPPNPTLPSHCSTSHFAQPLATASRTEPPVWSELQATKKPQKILHIPQSYTRCSHGHGLRLSPAPAAFSKFQVLITKGRAAWFRGSKQMMANTIWIILQYSIDIIQFLHIIRASWSRDLSCNFSHPCFVTWQRCVNEYLKGPRSQNS